MKEKYKINIKKIAKTNKNKDRKEQGDRSYSERVRTK